MQYPGRQAGLKVSGTEAAAAAERKRLYETLNYDCHVFLPACRAEGGERKYCAAISISNDHMCDLLLCCERGKTDVKIDTMETQKPVLCFLPFRSFSQRVKCNPYWVAG